jgi:spermidine synthase
MPMHAQDSKSLLAYLLFTAVVSGALVMVIEVLGSRVIGPFFGVSLFVWTALITVTLVALAAGYAAGGWLADRRSSPDWLYGIILAAGLAVIIVPALKPHVLQACVPLGLRTGTLASAGLLFGPALFLLGCVSPYMVKITARELKNLGRTVGGLYALSTLGSFLGTVGTGFVLIAYLGVNRIFLATGIALIALAAGYFVLFRRRWAALALLALPFAAVPGEAPLAKNLADGTRVTRVHGEDSYYGNLKVLDYQFPKLRTRELIIDGLVQGGIDTANGLSVYEYAYLMQFLPVALKPDARRCLVIGLGAGVVPTWFARHGVTCDVVDIDPAVPEIARRYFGFRPSGRVFVEDARYFLASTDSRYDYIVLDVFNGDTTPGHLLSLEAMRLMAARLAADGVLVINLVGSLDPKHATLSVVRTLEQVFANVRVHPLFAMEQGISSGNMAIAAYNGPPRAPDLARIAGFPVHPAAEKEVRAALTREFRFPPQAQAVLLTDDFNPVDFQDLWLKERVRQIILDTTDWDMLLG